MTNNVAGLSVFPVFRAFDSTGNPLAGGSLYTYQAGTTTPLATYTDNTASTPNTNPVVLDSTGTANVWLSNAAYKFILKDANGNTQWTVDQINAASAISAAVNVLSFGAVGDGSTDDSTAFTNASAAAGSWGSVIVPRPSVSYKLGSNVTNDAFWLLMGGAATSGTGTLAGITIQQVSGGAINIGGTTFYITSAGKVGIGTAAPAELLDVAGNINFPNVSSNPNGMLMWNDVSTIDFGVTTSDYFTLNCGQSGGFNGLILTPGSGGSADIALKNGAFYTPVIPGSGSVNSSRLDNTQLSCDTYTNGSITSVNIFHLSGTLLSMKGNNKAMTFYDPSDTNYCSMNMLNIQSSNQSAIFYWGCLRTDATHVANMLTLTNTSGVQIASVGNGAVGHGTCGSLIISGNQSYDEASSYGGIIVISDYQSSGTSYAMKFCRGSSGPSASAVGTISTSSSATAYNTSSDYRLKENLTPIDNALDIIKAVPMYKGNFKISPNEVVTFGLAHEMQKYIPNAVMGEKDGKKTHKNIVMDANGKILHHDHTYEQFVKAQNPEDEVSHIYEPTTIESTKIIKGEPTTVKRVVHVKKEVRKPGKPRFPSTAQHVASLTVEDYQQADYSKLVPILWAAVQQLVAKVEELEHGTGK